VVARCEAVAAAAPFRQAADLLVDSLSKTTSTDVLRLRSKALGVVVARLGGAGAAHAGRAADVLIAGVDKSPNSAVGPALEEISAWLDAAEAARTAGSLVAAMSQAADFLRLNDLRRGLASVSARLDGEGAATAAAALVAAMSKTADEQKLLYMGLALAVVS